MAFTAVERATATAAAVILFHKREKATVRALLAAETETLHRTRAAAMAAQAHLAAAVLEDDERPDRVAQRVQSVVPVLVAGLAAALVVGAREAKERARKVSGVPGAELLRVSPLLSAPEQTFAEVTAASAANGWAASAVGELRMAEATPGAALRLARKKLAKSLERISATETALAFNRELRDLQQGKGAYRAPPEEPGGNVVDLHPVERWVVWSAVVDGRTCRECYALHGTAVLARASFPLGDPPLHPFCRCVPVFLILPRGIDSQEFAAALALAA
jgi:hypothetical protein